MSRREWLAELNDKERNILPPDTIRNDAAVEKLLINGDRPLTPVQRVAAILFSFLWLGVGAMVWFADIDIAHGIQSNPILAVAALLIALAATAFTYIGFRMAWNGIVGGRKVGRHE